MPAVGCKTVSTPWRAHAGVDNPQQTGTNGEGLALRGGYKTFPVSLFIYALDGQLSLAPRRPDDVSRRLSSLAAH
jgi:hypothetical protein